jgi:hypothetical protein
MLEVLYSYTVAAFLLRTVRVQISNVAFYQLWNVSLCYVP